MKTNDSTRSYPHVNDYLLSKLVFYSDRRNVFYVMKKIQSTWCNSTQKYAEIFAMNLEGELTKWGF